MINEENLNKLYQRVIEGCELTTKELNAMGLNSKDLSDLIQDGSLIRVKRGLYTLKNVDGLFFYGKKLIADKEYVKGIACFYQCFVLDPTHKGASFRLFINCLKEENYPKAFEYFDVFYNSDNPFYQTDYNFYLYMLSMITEIPEKYREYTKSLKYDDIKIKPDDKRYDNIDLQNNVRLSVYKLNFYAAITQLNEDKIAKKRTTVQDLVISTLIVQAIKAQSSNRKYIINLIKQEKYQELAQFYEKQMQSHRLGVSHRYSLKLIQILIDMTKSKKIPQLIAGKNGNVFAAIDNNNYELALSLEKEHNRMLHHNDEEDCLYLLLERIETLIKKLKEDIVLPLEETKDSVEVEKEKTPKEDLKPLTSTFNDVVNLLMQNALDNAYVAIRSYLSSINKSAYEFLILDLIKISLIKKDVTFTEPMKALTLISEDNYTFDIATFIQEFYLELSQDNFELARIYLDIISKGNSLGQECIITDGLYQILAISEKELEYKRKNMVATPVVIEDNPTTSYEFPEAKNNDLINLAPVSYIPTNIPENLATDILVDVSEDVPVETDAETFETKVSDKTAEQAGGPANTIKTIEKEAPKFPVVEDSNKDKENYYRGLVEEKHQKLLENQGIILLEPMDEEAINKILEIVNDYSDMKAFTIEDKESKNRQVVLKPHQIFTEYFDVKGTISLAVQTYNEGKYDECIDYCLQILRFFPNPNSASFSKLGLCYLKKNNISLAITYLTVADALAKKEHLSYDFSALIARLKREQNKKVIKDEDAKPFFNMTYKAFSNTIDYYGINNFNEINAFVIDTGFDVEYACKTWQISNENTLIIYLIYAREFYRQGNFERGDLFLDAYVKSEGKTKKAQKIYMEIIKRKKFYQNSKNDDAPELTLSLIPKKKS